MCVCARVPFVYKPSVFVLCMLPVTLQKDRLRGSATQVVRTQETSCSSDSRLRRTLSGTTGHRLLGTQRPQMVWLTAWVWCSLTTEFVEGALLGERVNPHREQHTIPQGQTSSAPKFFFTPPAKARPDQAALATSAEARGATHRARPRSPSLCRLDPYPHPHHLFPSDDRLCGSAVRQRPPHAKRIHLPRAPPLPGAS